MKNYDVLDAYINLQKEIIFDKVINFRQGLITFCQFDNATDWNFALVNKVLSEKELEKVEKEFIKLNRTSSIYFENNQELFLLKELLLKKGYIKTYEDSWMFYAEKSVKIPEDYKVIHVENDKELDIFLDVFNRCFQKNDLQNPYGEWGKGYLKTISYSWNKFHRTKKIEFFIIYSDEEPVAVSELIHYKDMGYITNIGSLGCVRGQGFGKLATLYCVKRSIERGNIYHCLATEAGQYPHKFYKRIGFKTKFTAIDYTKKIKY